MELSDDDPRAIAYVDLDNMFVLLNCGDSIPITDLLDADGDPCGPDDAFALVAGADDLGWWSLSIEEMGDPLLN